jgi:hypothetical protein
MDSKAYGGTLHANPAKEFLSAMIKNNYISNESMTAVDVTNVQISKISGKAATADTPGEWVVDTIAYAENP